MLKAAMGTADIDTLLGLIEKGRKQKSITAQQSGSAWEAIGPDNVPGRLTALTIDSQDGAVYAGTAGGGVFKTYDAGETWESAWLLQESLAIGGIAVAPSDRKIIYASTGEWGLTTQGIMTMPGVGVYRTHDRGLSWYLLAPIPSVYTNGIAVDPQNADLVYVAGNTGLHRSHDGGTTWDPGSFNNAPCIYGVFDGVISDVVIDPGNPNAVWIGVHEQGVFTSPNGIDGWTRVSELPADLEANAPRIAFSREGAFVAVKIGGRVFTRAVGAATFQETPERPADTTADSSFPYTNVISVHPTNENILLAGGVTLFRSEDGGATWNALHYVGPPLASNELIHVDKHAVVFSPRNPDHVYQATDGGIYDSFNLGRTWIRRAQRGLNTTQCYSIDVSQGDQLVYGITTQDNYCYQSSGGNSFEHIYGQEGGWIRYDPNDANIIYVDSWFAPYAMVKSIDGGRTWQTLPLETTDQLHRYAPRGLAIAWNYSQLLLATRRGGRGASLTTIPVARSKNGGASWRDTLYNEGVAITAVAFAPGDDNHAYAGSIDGRVWHSLDTGERWIELDRYGLPEAPIQTIEVDWRDPLRIYVAFGAAGVRQVWRGDVGSGSRATWVDCSGSPSSVPDLPVTALVIDPDNDGVLYASNLLGVYRTPDAGNSWTAFDEALPNCLVTDLRLRRRDRSLYASTFGRGVYRRFI